MKLTDAWCPDRPFAERVARLILDSKAPALGYHLTNPNAVRAFLVLESKYPGNSLPGVIDQRDRLLAEEVARVETVVQIMRDVIELTSLELAVSP